MCPVGLHPLMLFSFVPHPPYEACGKLLLFVGTVFWSLVDKVHELIQLRRDDNLGTAVALFAQFGVVAGQRVVLATATGSETLRLYAIVVL